MRKAGFAVNLCVPPVQLYSLVHSYQGYPHSGIICCMGAALGAPVICNWRVSVLQLVFLLVLIMVAED